MKLCADNRNDSLPISRNQVFAAGQTNLSAGENPASEIVILPSGDEKHLLLHAESICHHSFNYLVLFFLVYHQDL